MFAFIEGEVIRINERTIIVVANSVGYEINVSSKLKAENGEKVSIYTHLIHKEDSMSLYGFQNREEKNMFLTLLSAQGIGPKLAIEILSVYSIGEIIEILFARNIDKLKKIPGMGVKKAEKLMFELKDKIEKIDINILPKDPKTQSFSDALKALMSLGFSQNEASNAIKQVENIDSKTTESIIVAALKALGNR